MDDKEKNKELFQNYHDALVEHRAFYRLVESLETDNASRIRQDLWYEIGRTEGMAEIMGERLGMTDVQVREDLNRMEIEGMERD